MACHAEITAALETTKVYFWDPHSPWQRPSNEHTNGVLRDYFPKGTDLSLHTPEELALVQAEVTVAPVGSSGGTPQNPGSLTSSEHPSVATLTGPTPTLPDQFSADADNAGDDGGWPVQEHLAQFSGSAVQVWDALALQP